jgi:pimeloyl-ACP methyl ester carboxylesterase
MQTAANRSRVDFVDRRKTLGVLVVLPLVSGGRASAAAAIKDESFVNVGGIEQWITIKGSDSANPVVLFLHGGPGDALSPYADDRFKAWEKEFTIVQWDQRGAGRTFGKSGPSIEPTMTMERMVQDGIEVAEYLTSHLGKRKIILVGGSWGSILGIYMVHARPDLFYAYVGQAQVVNWQKNLSASYARVLQMAEAAKDRETVAALNAIGPPPWKTVLPQWRTYRKAEQAYQAKIVTAPDAPERISAAYGGSAERKQYSEAEDFSMFHFWSGRQPRTTADFTNLPMSGPLTMIDLPGLGTDFKIPIYIVQGQADLTALPELAKIYFDGIKAPRKGFYLVPGTGHEPSKAMMDTTWNILLEEVKPLAK